MLESTRLIFTHSRIYRQIAEEALHTADAEMAAHRTPREDGEPGYVLQHDPAHRSLKQSMIAVVFAGMYIESRLWLEGCHRLGVDEYRKVDKLALELRLPRVGITDPVLIAATKAYRESRRDLVHEKAVPLPDDQSPIRVAQREATRAVALMAQIDSALTNTGTAFGVIPEFIIPDAPKAN